MSLLSFNTIKKYPENLNLLFLFYFTVQSNVLCLEVRLVGWLVGFYGMSTHWVILCLIRFYLRTHLRHFCFIHPFGYLGVFLNFFMHIIFFINSCFDLFNP